MSTFFKINDNDYSMYVNKLMIGKEHIYNQKTSAAGNSMVQRINSKRTIEVGIIPLDDATMMKLMTDINQFVVGVSYLDPETNRMTRQLACYIPTHLVEYYTIQVGNVKYRAFTLQIKEL